MSTTTLPPCPHFELPAVTKEPLDYTDVIVVDFANHTDPARRPQLARELSAALHESGYCFLVNHGLDAAQVQRTFDVADIPFSGASDAEKLQFEMRSAAGSYKGYKIRGAWEVTGGQRENCEMYNITTDFAPESHPPSIHPYLPELAQFSAFFHKEMAHEIMRLLALDLQVPEDTLVDMHQYGEQGESYTRLMKYYPRATDEAEALAANLWLSGHTDVGSLTILLSQPISGLQFHCRDNKWRRATASSSSRAGTTPRTTTVWSRPRRTSGRHLERLGVGYFLRPDNATRLDVLPSAVLQAHGTISSFDGTSMDWRDERVRLRGIQILNGSRIPRTVPIVEAGPPPAPPVRMVQVGA
ncbi:hypothetical protein HWV62_8140 [Athelia sp. TMB]|nr:hypothetical protein HWV62_8140 [Athelia sp. TMB]